MRVIPPVPVTAAMLTSSSVSEPSAGEATWSSGTTYKLGDQVIDTTTHRTYESQQGAQATVTLPIASPGIATWANHGLAAGTPVLFTNSGGALPTGLTAGTIYYVLADTVNTFKVSATIGGSAINFTGSQSGVHTATANPNKGNPPTTDDGTWWIDVGPSNKWAMFDLLRSTATTGPSPLTVVITPGRRIDSIGLVGLVADSLEVTVTSVAGGGTVYHYGPVYLLNRPCLGWYDYFFSEFRYRSEAALFDLPPYTDAVITITLTRASGNAACGGLVIGQSAYIGRTQHNATHEGLNFSRIERDSFGNSSLTPRRTVPKTNQQVRASKANVPRLLLLIEDLNAVPAFWSGIDDQDSGYFGALLIVGIYKTFAINMDQPNEALVTLELEEV